MKDITKYNREAWDHLVTKQDRWTIPVTGEEIASARLGKWGIVLTATKSVPLTWFPDLQGCRVLGLACGGGQQGPILAALGADVTIFDSSPKQLGQDQMVSDQYHLNITTVQGDMRDLSVFKENSFDLIFNPCSVCFVEDVIPVWQECFRVLCPGGILMAGLMHPLAFQHEENEHQYFLAYPRPYADLLSLPEEKLSQLREQHEPWVFGHSLEAQIGGQLQAGFLLTDLYEDDWGGQHGLDSFFPSFIATRAIKPSSKKNNSEYQ